MPLSIRSLTLLATMALLVFPGCVGSRALMAACGPAKSEFRDVLFVADGAGDFRVTSQTVDQVVQEIGLPLCVEPIVWSHGYGRIFADQIDRRFAQEQGHQLADTLRERKRTHPECRIYLLAHSAGSRVILAAAENMPANSIERVVLLGPSVEANYDLRCALRATCRSIDVYYSPDHDYYLRGAAVLAAVFHAEFSRRAGQVGFRPQVETDEDCQLYSKLRLIPWDPLFSDTGNRGGHYGARQPEFLKDYVLPLMSEGLPRLATRTSPVAGR